MAVKTEAKIKKTLLESTEIDEVLYQKMKEIYAEYTGLQIAAVIGKIRKEIELEREEAGLLADLDRIQARREVLATLKETK